VAAEADKLGQLKTKVRGLLSAAGANEVLTYGFVHSELLKKAGVDPDNSYKLINSISPELEYIRQSLTPSLLDKTYTNLKAGYDGFALFEINKISQKSDGLNDEKVPIEKNKVALVLVNDDLETDTYYSAKWYLEYLLIRLGVTPEFRPLEPLSAVARPFENKRAAGVYDKTTGQVIGVVGEYKNAVRKSFKLPNSVAGFEFGLDYVQKVAQDRKPTYAANSKYPSVERDITFRVSESLKYQDIEDLIRKALEAQQLDFQLVPVSIYQGEDKKTKNVSFRITFASHDKTLTPEEINKVVSNISNRAKAELKAETI
jgi:phenylalanyl-tRNA synthetase beta chain